MAALEQLQAPYAEWQLPGAIAASAPQQAPAAQVGGEHATTASGFKDLQPAFQEPVGSTSKPDQPCRPASLRVLGESLIMLITRDLGFRQCGKL